MNRKRTLTLLAALAAISLLSSCGPSQGASSSGESETAIQGSDGKDGVDGKDGKDGSSILTGEGMPNNNSGKEGGLYLDTASGDLYMKTASGWEKSCNLKGKDGVSISEVKFNDEGNLLIVYSDGTSKVCVLPKEEAKTHTVTFYFEKRKLGEAKVKHGERAKEPTDLSVEGYDISSWWCNEDGGYRWLFSAYPVLDDLSLYAKYSASTGLDLRSEDSSKGTAEVVETKTENGVTSYEVQAKAKEGYAFEGWYSGDAWVSQFNPTTYSPSSSPASLTARFITQDEFDQKYGVTPEISDSTVTFGLYPQTLVKDSEVLAALNSGNISSNGNLYYCYKGVYYAKAVANPAVSASSSSSEEGGISQATTQNYKFSDGETEIEKGKTYWFKCERISWRILSTGEGTYSLVSEKVLDGSLYDADSNNYEESDLRHWLNNSFYSAAFGFGASEGLKLTSVDNSAASTGASSNPYYCQDTEDRVFLPSYKEVFDGTEAALYPDMSDRRSVATDYARAVGVDCSNYPDQYSYAATYWTRSPDESVTSAATSVHCVSPEGSGYNYCYINRSLYGVRPCITLSPKAS